MKSKHLIGRAVLIGLMVLSVGMLWWSLAIRLPEINRVREANQQAFRLQDQVEQLKLRKTEVGDQVTNKLNRAFSQMFGGLPSVRDWFSGIARIGKTNGFAVTPSPSEPAPAPAPFQEEVLVVPTTVRIEPTGQPSAQENQHSLLVDTLQAWLNSGRRIALERLTVAGDGRGVSEATLSLRLWVRQGAEANQ